MKKALLIIAQKNYQDRELDGTRKGLQEANFDVVIASVKAGACTGKFGGTEQASIALKDVDVADYDRVAFIGGPGAGTLWQDKEAQRIARETAEAGKPLGAICIAPKVLVAAGVLDGKKATVWNDDGDQAGFLALHNVEYTGEDVTVDGLVVTANGPKAAVEFGRTLGRLRA